MGTHAIAVVLRTGAQMSRHVGIKTNSEARRKKVKQNALRSHQTTQGLIY